MKLTLVKSPKTKCGYVNGWNIKKPVPYAKNLLQHGKNKRYSRGTQKKKKTCEMNTFLLGAFDGVTFSVPTDLT